jgi:hypothetical protein
MTRRTRASLVCVWLLAAWPAAGASAQETSGLAKPAPALPQWLEVSGDYRVRFESVDGARFQAGNDDAYVLNRLRLGATLLAAASWRVVVQAQDSRVFLKTPAPAGPPFRDVIDARLAFVEIGARVDAPVTARIGRQELAFGEQRLIGTADWLNTGRTFDAARVTLKRSRATVDAFAGYVVRVMPEQLNRPDAGNLLYGVNIVAPHLLPGVIVEPYVIGHRAPNQAQETGGHDTGYSTTMGARWTAAGLTRVDAGAEVAGQIGSIGADSIRAWAGHWALGFTFVEARRTPRLFAEYNYASGDDNRGDGRRQTFDQLYPTGHDKLGLADQVGWKNIHHARSGIEIRPSARTTASVRYHSWWLSSSADALYDAAGSIVVAGDAARGRHVGQEVDAQATFTAPHKLRLAAGYAHIFPGALLLAATGGHAYSFPYLSISAGF